jgi:hypothetical protein
MVDGRFGVGAATEAAAPIPQQPEPRQSRFRPQRRVRIRNAPSSAFSIIGGTSSRTRLITSESRLAYQKRGGKGSTYDLIRAAGQVDSKKTVDAAPFRCVCAHESLAIENPGKMCAEPILR